MFPVVQKFDCEFSLGSSNIFPTLYTEGIEGFTDEWLLLSFHHYQLSFTSHSSIPPSVAWFDTCEKGHPGLGVLMFLGVGLFVYWLVGWLVWLFFLSPITLQRLCNIYTACGLVLGFRFCCCEFFSKTMLVYHLLMKMSFFFYTWVLCIVERDLPIF